MSALPVETIEPDPASTSVANDETVNKAGLDESAPTEKSAEAAEVKPEATKETNGSSEVKEAETAEKAEEKSAEKNGDSKKGDFKKNYDPNRRQYNKPANHSKYDPSVLEATDDHKQIRGQVEFYFGDANLPTDQYLWDLTDGANNVPVLISTICRFGRMKRFEPVSNVVAALRQSQILVVEGPEGEETVRRKVAYDPAAPKNSSIGRSVYVKGFGSETRSSQFDIEAFFAPFGPTNAVRLRRTPDKEFKGSVFVEFADEETAEKFLALDPKPKWKGTEELEIKSKKAYTDGKELDIKEGRMQPSESWVRGSGRGGRGRGRGRGGDRGSRGGRGRGDRKDRGDRGDRDPNDWKKRREEDRASGFKDNKRGDRRGGRGGRGGQRGGRDDRNSDRKEENVKTESSEKVEATNEKKRSREEDAPSEQPAKKVDNKSEPTAASS